MNFRTDENNKRSLEYDILRIIAICAVILIHCTGDFVMKYNNNTCEFIIGNILDSMARIAVPFFLFISGTFMLNEHKNLSIQKIKNKILKATFVLIFWSSLYAVCYNYKHFFKAFIYGHYHLWYLYLIIGLYLITPILRLFVRKENEI